LELADKFIHGVLITLSIDKKIESSFGITKKIARQEIVELFQTNDLGLWKGKEAEKVLCVCHIIGIFMSLVAHSGQKFLWLCDQDSINPDGITRDFSHTQKILGHCLLMYSENLYEIYGFAKPFKQDIATTDLLSVTDFSAGIVQEIMQHALKCKNIQLSPEKEKLAKWMGTKSNTLIKVNFALTKDNNSSFSLKTMIIKKGNTNNNSLVARYLLSNLPIKSFSAPPIWCTATIGMSSTYNYI
jgi:hypothetical protein